MKGGEAESERNLAAGAHNHIGGRRGERERGPPQQGVSALRGEETREREKAAFSSLFLCVGSAKGDSCDGRRGREA